MIRSITFAASTDVVGAWLVSGADISCGYAFTLFFDLYLALFAHFISVVSLPDKAFALWGEILSFMNGVAIHPSGRLRRSIGQARLCLAKRKILARKGEIFATRCSRENKKQYENNQAAAKPKIMIKTKSSAGQKRDSTPQDMFTTRS